MENAVTIQPLGRARTATRRRRRAARPAGRRRRHARPPRTRPGRCSIVRIATDGDPAAADRGAAGRRHDRRAAARVREQRHRGGAAVEPADDRLVARRPARRGSKASRRWPTGSILDADDPWPLWSRTPPLFEQTAFTDMRWAAADALARGDGALLRPARVRESARRLHALSIAARDRAAGGAVRRLARRVAGLARPRARGIRAVERAPLESVTLGGRRCELVLQLLPRQHLPVDAEGRDRPTH